MPSGDYSGKERQSVYEKALVISHEGEKKLSLLKKDLDRSKLQTYISYKLEERELRKELFRIKREQISLAKEAKQRQRDNKSIDDIAKEIKVTNPGNRGATAIQLEKKFSLPHINCTQKNVPMILRRKLSHESEYFTWTFGLPTVENAVKALNPSDGGKVKQHVMATEVKGTTVREELERIQFTASCTTFLSLSEGKTTPACLLLMQNFRKLIQIKEPSPMANLLTT